MLCGCCGEPGDLSAGRLLVAWGWGGWLVLGGWLLRSWVGGSEVGVTIRELGG